MSQYRITYNDVSKLFRIEEFIDGIWAADASDFISYTAANECIKAMQKHALAKTAQWRPVDKIDSLDVSYKTQTDAVYPDLPMSREEFLDLIAMLKSDDCLNRRTAMRRHEEVLLILTKLYQLIKQSSTVGQV